MTPALRVRLLGRFCLQESERLPPGLDGRRVQELFSYLLLNRQPQNRAALADQLWADGDSLQSKKSLRQALWHLQSALESFQEPGNAPFLLVAGEWIQLNPEARLWADVIDLERACVRASDTSGGRLDDATADFLAAAVASYRGELLSGWYQDWCLFERERLQQLYLTALDKLIERSEVRREYERGVSYAVTSLRHNPMRERTHRHLIRLYYLAGDRVAALRQYERCSALLDAELGVTPASSTRRLYEEIQADRLEDQLRPSGPAVDQEASEPELALRAEAQPPVAALLARLHELAASLTSVQRQIYAEIQALERLDA